MGPVHQTKPDRQSCLLQKAVAPQAGTPESHSVQCDPMAPFVGQRTYSPSSTKTHAMLLNRAKSSEPSMAHLALVQLQRQYGNRYVQRVMALSRQIDGSDGAKPVSCSLIQPKLVVNAPGDQYEQEADQVAKAIVLQEQQPALTKTSTGGVNRQVKEEEKPVQTKAADVSAYRQMEEEEEKPVQAKAADASIYRQMEEEKEKPVQAKATDASVYRQMEEEKEKPVQTKMGNISIQRQANGDGAVPTEVEAAIQGSRDSGQGLDSQVRAQMEPAFGADFGGVRVHSDTQADALNHSLSARAFTTGQDIFFRQGEYNPGSSNGQELLAHELTHVVQQSGGAVHQKEAIS